MANQTTPVIQIKDSNVGIGTNSPLYKLDVIGDISFPSRNTAGTYRIGMGREDGNGWTYTQNIAFISDGGGGYITFSTQQPGVGGGEYMRLNYTGNLLIGTTTDSGYKLDVNGTGRFSNSLLVTTSAAGSLTAKIRNTVTSASGSTGYGLAIESEASGATSYALTVRNLAESTTYFHISTATGSVGNVGIGTTSPTQKLDVATGNIALGYNQTATNSLYKDFATYHAAGNVPSELSMVIYDGSPGAVRIKNTRTGSYNSQAIHFDVHEGGVAARGNAMIINYTGNVLIGTTTDAGYKLDVNGNVRIGVNTGSARLNVGGAANEWVADFQASTTSNQSYGLIIRAGTNSNDYPFYVVNAATNVFFFSIRGDGNVGIGTTSPNMMFSVKNLAGITSDGQISWGIGTGFMNWDTGYVSISGQSGTALVLGSNGSEKMRITSAGNVGIGTTSPLFNLQVGANAGTIATTTIRLQNSYLDTNGYYGFNIDAVDNGVDGHDLRFLGRTSPTSGFSELVRIKNGGNVGIGTTAPVTKLQVTSATNAVDVLRIGNTAGDSGSVQGFTHLAINHFNAGTFPSTRITAYQDGVSGWPGGMYFSTREVNTDSAPLERLRITSAGNVGINTTNPTSRLEVVGDARITTGSLGVGVAPNATDGRIDASNDIVAFSTSDRRLKENITPIANALEKVRSLTGVEFDWKEETKSVHGYEGHDVGVIAQDVQAVLPEAVRTNDSGYLSVRYEKMIALLVEANKELADRVEQLEKLIK